MDYLGNRKITLSPKEMADFYSGLTLGDYNFFENEYVLIEDEEKLKDLSAKEIQGGAALFHDIGKGFCKTFYNTKGEKTKEAHYYDHQNYGAYLSMFISQSKMSINERWTRAVIIQYHMEPYIRQNGLEKFYDWIGEDFSKDIKIIHLADKLAH